MFSTDDRRRADGRYTSPGKHGRVGRAGPGRTRRRRRDPPGPRASGEGAPPRPESVDRGRPEDGTKDRTKDGAKDRTKDGAEDGPKDGAEDGAEARRRSSTPAVLRRRPSSLSRSLSAAGFPVGPRSAPFVPSFLLVF